VGEADAPSTPPFIRTVACQNVFSPGSVRGTTRSPRCRGDRSAVGRAVGRSPSSRGRRDLAVSQGVTEATIDQSANCGWATVNGTHDDVALLPDTVCHIYHLNCCIPLLNSFMSVVYVFSVSEIV